MPTSPVVTVQCVWVPARDQDAWLWIATVIVRLFGVGFLLFGAIAAWQFRQTSLPPADFCYLNKADLNTLDPAQISWNQDIRVALNIWEGLVTFHPSTTVPVEGAAYFPPEMSDDNRVYTFRIRDDARWSNGDPLTSLDFVRGWRRCMEPGTAGDYTVMLTDKIVGASDYYRWRTDGMTQLVELYRRAGNGDDQAAADHAKLHQSHAAEMDERFAALGLQALDDKTLQVRLIRPCAYFLDLCAFTPFLPCHESVELLRDRHQNRPINAQGLVAYDPQWTKPDWKRNGYPGLITNGPYRLASWVFKRGLRMEANPHYWDAESVRCKVIESRVYDDLNTALMAYEAGDLDFLPEMQVDYDQELVRLTREGLRPDFHFPSVFGTYYYLFNCLSTEVNGQPNPFVDARVRKAFALAIEKKALVDKVLGRGDPVSDHFVPVNSISGYVSPPATAHNPDEARRWLAEAGYAGGVGLPVVELLYNTGYQHGKVCEVLAKMWERELGATVRLVGKEAKTFAEDKVGHNFMVARAGWYGDYGDPTTFLDIFVTGNGNNDAGFSNSAYDALLSEAETQSDPKKRFALLAKAERLLVVEEMPAIPLYQYTNLLAIKPHVKGLYPNPRLMFPFRYLDIER